MLSKATVFAEFTDGLERRARELNALGIRPLDALHLASAVAAEADFLCTCDDRFLRKGEGTTMVQNAKESASPPLWRA